MLDKKVSFAFGKEVYFLGKDEDGTKYWLEAPSWECGWYWDFGYIETYQGNRTPEKAVDIDSHQHATYFYSVWCNKILKETTFSDEEKWALCELFSNFYTLRTLADAQHHNGIEGNYTSKRHGFDYNTLLNKDINKECLPFVMAKIVSILSGKDTEELEKKYQDMVKVGE